MKPVSLSEDVQQGWIHSETAEGEISPRELERVSEEIVSDRRFVKRMISVLHWIGRGDESRAEDHMRVAAQTVQEAAELRRDGGNNVAKRRIG